MRAYLGIIAAFIVSAAGLLLGLWMVAGASTCLFVPQSASDDVSEYVYPPVPCSSPCIIEFSPGGVMDLFAAEGRQLAADHTLVIVDGPCISACTILVDFARANVCLTHNAILGYHQWSMDTEGGTKHGDVSYLTPGLDAYLKARGGLPYTPDTGHILLLNFAEARQFYRAC